MRKGYSIKTLQENIGYCFKDEKLLRRALTHRSYVNEMQINKTQTYERLEFLGDAVLELITTEFLFRNNPEVPEGTLTKMRASIVCEQTLALCSKCLNLGEYLLLGKGEENTGGRTRDSITSDAMEAVIGALYIDGGTDAAKNFVEKFVLSDIENKTLFLDSKTTFQEFVQGKLKKDFKYEVVSETGPEHDKIFGIDVYIGDEYYGSGSGRTKKYAEQQAAYNALLLLKERNLFK